MKHSVINCPFPFMLEYSLDFVHSYIDHGHHLLKSWAEGASAIGYVHLLRNRRRCLPRVLVNRAGVVSACAFLHHDCQ